jgi:hypothetical protein
LGYGYNYQVNHGGCHSQAYRAMYACLSCLMGEPFPKASGSPVTGELAVDVGVTLVLSFSGLATLLLGRSAASRDFMGLLF